MSGHSAHERGLGAVVRFAGALVPLILGFAVALGVDEGSTKPPPAGPSTDFFQALGVPWGWPYRSYREWPLLFGVIGLSTLVFLAMLGWRRDWRGGVAVLLWSLLISWLISGAMLQG